MKLKPIIPADVDPIKLADEMKKGLTTNWIKRREALKAALGRQSQ